MPPGSGAKAQGRHREVLIARREATPAIVGWRVVTSQYCSDFPHFVELIEQVRAEHLVAIGPVGAFDVGVFIGFCQVG